MEHTVWQKPYRGVLVDRSHPLARGLVGCWLFNEGVGGRLFDLSGNGNHAVLTNMDPATDWVGGPDGWALDLDGSNDYIRAGSIGFDPTGEFTIVARVYGYNLDKDGSVHRTVISQQDGTGTGRGLMGVTDATHTMRCNLGGTLTLGPVLSVNKWYQCATVYGGGTVTLYRDLESGGGNSVTGEAADGDFIIGASKWTSSGRWDGRMRCLLVYSRALSVAELTWLYREPYCFVRGVVNIASAFMEPATVRPFPAVYADPRQVDFGPLGGAANSVRQVRPAGYANTKQAVVN